ncbi:hypothetical protein Vi05172_g5025 [Venturia inaequalis]|nr:hypothetical protein Vi05172_g5025 [Venturia inaequalis]
MTQKHSEFRINSFNITEETRPVLPITAKTESATTPKTSSTSKKPTSFLTLPHELRQQILLSAWSITTGEGRLAPFPGSRVHVLQTLDELSSAARQLLLTDPEINEDVAFIIGKWIEELKVFLEDMVKKLRSLNSAQPDKEGSREFETTEVKIAGWVVQVEFIGGFCYGKGTGLKADLFNSIERTTSLMVLGLGESRWMHEGARQS